MGRLNWAILAAVAFGSAAGGVARHLLTEAVLRVAGQGFPWGTIVVNVSGSLAIGGLTALAGTAVPATWPPVWRDAAITGVLGGFTTFSTFSVQTLALLQQGQMTSAIANVALSVALGLAACWAGFALVSAAGR
jgi:fluoride exporter